MTVVIPVYNGAHILPTTVPAVLALDVERIVYVDDGSTDGSFGLLKALTSGDSRVSLHSHDANRGRSAARNTGLAAVESPRVLLLDADVEPLAGYGTHMRETLDSPGVIAAVAGTIDYADARGAYGVYLRSGSRGPASSHGPIPWRHLLSGLCAVRVDALDAAGRFDESIAYGEDLAVATRLWRQAPEGLRVSPEARARLHDVGGLDVAVRNVRAFAEGLTQLSALDADVLRVAGLDRVASTRAQDRLLRALARWSVPAAGVQAVIERLPEALQPLAVRYLLGHTLVRHV